MITKIVGALAGKAAAKHTSKIGGPGGAVLGAIAVPLISRMRLSKLLLFGVGGYAVKKVIDRRAAAASPTGPKAQTPPKT